MKYGRLTYIRDTEPSRFARYKKRRALWRCECGREKDILMDSVVRGKTRSCGCQSQVAMRRSIDSHMVENAAKAKKRRKPACYCGAVLLDSGTCRFSCPKRDPRIEMREAARKRRENEHRCDGPVGMSEAERKRVCDVMGKIDPLWDRWQARVRRGAVKSHAPGARR